MAARLPAHLLPSHVLPACLPIPSPLFQDLSIKLMMFVVEFKALGHGAAITTGGGGSSRQGGCAGAGATTGGGPATAGCDPGCPAYNKLLTALRFQLDTDAASYRCVCCVSGGRGQV